MLWRCTSYLTSISNQEGTMAPQARNDGRKSTILEQDSSVPRYYQLKEIIREQCASWEPGQLIPSELELCQMYSVSRTTVRKALDHLTQEGLLYRIQGKGTFVAPPKLRERFVRQAAGIYEIGRASCRESGGVCGWAGV